MEYVIQLLRWTVEFIFKFCGLILIIIILLIILLACKIYDLFLLINNKTMPETLEDEETDDTEETK